jgi:hypothetical protein
MKLDDYQIEARKTAIYPGKLTYPSLGLCGEVGELTQVCIVPDVYNIKKEIGDCLWYVSNVAYDSDLLLSEICNISTLGFLTFKPMFLNREDACKNLSIQAGIVAENVKKTIRDNYGSLSDCRRKNIRNALVSILWALNYISTESDTTLNACAEANLEKLRSRQERGKLTGDGDNR